MSNRSDELNEFTHALFDEGVVREDLLEAVMGELGGPEESYSLIVPADPRWFDPGRIADRLSGARVDALYNGERPSPEELASWQEVIRAEAKYGGGDSFHMVSLWRIERAPGQELFCAALHEDQGTIAECLGPFRDRPEAERALRARGELSS
jgi:hypothetical protein